MMHNSLYDIMSYHENNEIPYNLPSYHIVSYKTLRRACMHGMHAEGDVTAGQKLDIDMQAHRNRLHHLWCTKQQFESTGNGSVDPLKH